MPRWLTSLLVVQGGTLSVVGGVLFLGGAKVHHFPDGAMSFWPWRLTPLSAQVIGAWLLALSVAAGLAILERNLNRLLVPAATYAAFGVFQLLVALRYWTQFTTGLPVGLGLHRRCSSRSPRPAIYGCWAATRSSDAAGGAPLRRRPRHDCRVRYAQVTHRGRQLRYERSCRHPVRRARGHCSGGAHPA